MAHNYDDSNSVAPIHADRLCQLLDLASQAATILSALPQSERLAARCKLVGRVARHIRLRRFATPSSRAESPAIDEVQRIADQMASLMGTTSVPWRPWLWARFNAAVRAQLSALDGDAQLTLMRWQANRAGGT